MKARVKATGEIVDAVITQRVTHTGEQVYIINDGCLIEESRLEFNVDDTLDYWTRLEHTYAGMAMQGILANYGVEPLPDDAANDARQYAHALVKTMKQ